MKKVGLSLLALAISSALVGCGGSDSDSKSTEPTETTSYSVPSSGSFVDATVEGLYYVSGTKSGYTSSTGVIM